ncbi:hypothetical protein ACH4TP_12850 [Streptomyces sp. NPDC021012]
MTTVREIVTPDATCIEFADTLPVRLPERPPEERPVLREDI